MMNEWLELAGKRYELDCKGYLIDMSLWDEPLLSWFATQEQIQITSDHRQVIDFIRNYFSEKKGHPVVRMISTAMHEILGPDKGSVKYFHILFPGGIHQAFKVAGLPMQHSCC